jgi:hypothetical protein
MDAGTLGVELAEAMKVELRVSALYLGLWAVVILPGEVDVCVLRIVSSFWQHR